MNDRYRFYYERLPACMRREYETFLQGILNRKERISFSGSFSIDCIRRIVDAVKSENAEAIWWLTDGVTYIAGAHGTTVLPNYSGLSAEEIGRRLQLLSAWKNAVVDAILRREPMCDVDKIWLIAQHVCSRMRYDNSDSISFEDRHPRIQYLSIDECDRERNVVEGFHHGRYLRTLFIPFYGLRTRNQKRKCRNAHCV